jgi:membrane-bound serine protease (ClpP class)
MEVVGVALLLVGAALLVAEAHAPGGILGGAGGLALAGGVALAIAGAGAGVALVLAATIAALAAAGLWVALAARKSLAVRALRPASGSEALGGRLGVVRSWGDRDGKVLVDGALWRARCSVADDGEGSLGAGDSIVVERVTGLTLAVRKAEEWEEPW